VFTLEARLLLIPEGSYVVDCARVFYSKETGHAATLTYCRDNFKGTDLILKVLREKTKD
jgi:hypothetical protein